MGLREAPRRRYQRSISGPVRLYLDDLDRILALLEERGIASHLEVGPDEAKREADSPRDLVDALPSERQHFTMYRNDDMMLETTYVVLNRDLAYAQTTSEDSGARVAVDRIAEFIEARPATAVRVFTRYWWMAGAAITGLTVLALFREPVLVIPLVALFAMLLYARTEMPTGVILVMHERHTAETASIERRRKAVWTAAAAIPAAMLGALVTWLLTR